MAWQSGGPGSKIPAWIKRQVRQRQHNCCNTFDTTVCTGRIDEFDHVINVKTLGIERSQANDPSNIQGLCRPCHNRKTQGEAHAAKRAKRFRTPPPHPGLVGKKVSGREPHESSDQ